MSSALWKPEAPHETYLYDNVAVAMCNVEIVRDNMVRRVDITPSSSAMNE